MYDKSIIKVGLLCLLTCIATLKAFSIGLVDQDTLSVMDRIEGYSERAWKLRDKRPDSSLFYANKALNLAKGHGYEDLEIQAINYIGVAYRNLSNYSKAFEKYLEALRLSEERGNQEQRGYSLINLGNLYLYQTNFHGAIKYFIQALDQAQSLANQRMVAYCFTNLGRSYKGINEYGQAELYFKQAIEIRKKQEDLYGQLSAEMELAEVYLLQGNLDKAENYHLALAVNIEPTGNPRMLGMVYNNVARVYLSKGELVSAKHFAQKAINITNDITTRYEEKNVLETLSRIYASGEDYKNAFQYHVRYAELNQQLFSEENIRKIEQLKGQYEMEQQEAETEFLRKQRALNELIISRQKVIIWLSTIGIVLLFLIAVLSIRAYLIKKRLSQKISKQKTEIEKDKTIIEGQSQKLKELDAAKSRFFANVSHDLRSPLSLIMGNLEMLQDDEQSVIGPNGQKNLEIGYKNCKRLLYLTDEINDLTRLEEGKISLKKEAISVKPFIQMLTDMFVGTAEYKGVNLRYSDQTEVVDCFEIDPRQFEKVFYNLVSNAIRHTAKGDSINISTQSIDERVVLEISDTGEGIPSDSLPHVFDRFYQSKSNEYKAREGLGIGLALVKELVELHGGSIEVSSIKGKGTTFTVAMPKVQAAGGGSAAGRSFSYVSERKALYDDIDREASAGVSIPDIGDKKSILIVDDHPEIRYHLRQILEDDYHIVEAAHGLEALELLKTNDIQLILSDLMMPWMDGFELINEIKSTPDYSNIPILVVSARISDTDQERVLYQGINDYLQKPFQKKELLLRITNLINQTRHQPQDVFAELFDKNKLDTVEKDIMIRLEQVVMEKIADEHLSVYQLADAMAASERQVYRLVKKLTGLTPFEYVTEVRMKYVDYLIRKKKVKNPTAAARSIGSKNVTAFSRQYEKRFGKKPAELLNSDS
ncbi:ATP-binding protein [Marinoscillum furvescens]|uniref:histidine kinase n=1 Tax=Marinoscillum furvescens DSM 4134 TaxID=1122208 RepID=A0A3D9L104_MARFU|nr:ATP-binding protein [Marinoscillum furvescens]RED97435.1 signal transduction histidine kinase [Marinoscillum furvescens DSM 4134]